MLVVWKDFLNSMNCKSLSYSHHQHMCQNLSINKMLSYFVENASNVLLIVSTWFLMLFLLILYQQFMSHFFLWSIISTKKFSAEWKLWLKTIAGISSRTCYIIPPTFLLRTWTVHGNQQLKIDPTESFCPPSILMT